MAAGACRGTLSPTAPDRGVMPPRAHHMYALAVMLGFSLIRLWIAASGQIDLAQDEAQYWDWSRRLQLSYYSKGPLIAWIIALWTHVFGNTELGVRFGAVLGNLGVQALLYYWLAALLQRPRLGLLTLCIANTTPLFIAGGILMTTDNPLLLCWAGGLVCLTAVTERPKASWPLAGLALCAAFGILAKYAMLFFTGIGCVYAWMLYAGGMLSRERFRHVLGALILGTVAGFLPILIWNADHDFVSFLHVGALAGVAGSGEAIPLIRFDRFPEYLGSQLGLVLPWWLLAMLWQGGRLIRRCRAHQGRGDVEADRKYRFHLLLCLGFWPVWSFFLLWSFHTRIYPNWSAMSYVAGIVLAAMWVEERLNDAQETRRKKGKPWLCLAAVLSLAVCVGLHGQQLFTSILSLPDRLNPTIRLKGWSDLGRQLEAARLAMPNPDKVFFFSDAYDVTAALAFYLPGQPVTYCVNFGRRLNQYDFWPDPNGETQLSAGNGAASPAAGAEHAGWDAIYVSARTKLKVLDRLRPMFTMTEEPVIAVETVHQGQPGRRFSYIPARGFTGNWPRASRSY